MQRSPKKRANTKAPATTPGPRPGANASDEAPPPARYLADARPWRRNVPWLSLAAIMYAAWLAWLVYAALNW